MRPRSHGWYAVHILVGQWLLLVLVHAGLVPYTVRPAGTGPDRPGLAQPHEMLRPRHEVDLHYSTEHPMNRRYVAIVTTGHSARPYVVIEAFEDHLAAISCASAAPTPTVRLALTFRQPEMWAAARDGWQAYDELTFITHHATCNDDFDERALYRYGAPANATADATADRDRSSTAIDFDEHARTVLITAHPTAFGPASDASHTIAFKGGFAEDELVERLSPRMSPEHQRLQKRDAHSYSFSLDEAWQEREELLSVLGFKATCVGCWWKGEIGVWFNLELPVARLADLTGPDLTTEQVQSMMTRMEAKVEVQRKVETNMGLELTVPAGMKLTWPGLRVGTPTIGNKILKKFTKNKWNIGKFRLQLTYRYGASFSVETAAQVQTLMPVHASIEPGQAVFVNVLHPLASSSSLYASPPRPWSRVLRLRVTVASARANVAGSKPKMHVGWPEVHFIDPHAKVSVGIGPGVDIELQVPMGANGETILNVVLQIRLQVPKLETVFAEAEGVEESCNPGPIKVAVEEQTTLGVGLEIEAWVMPKREGWVVMRFPVHKFGLGDVLHPEYTLDHRCFDLNHLMALDPSVMLNELTGGGGGGRGGGDGSAPPATVVGAHTPPVRPSRKLIGVPNVAAAAAARSHPLTSSGQRRRPSSSSSSMHDLVRPAQHHLPLPGTRDGGGAGTAAYTLADADRALRRLGSLDAPRPIGGKGRWRRPPNDNGGGGR
ncbi:MAG: hypothetical protein M1826_002968 [Phylliscum demangeonii]|nr:MAG: hypothetical protein M1826_002968 [Phylliscum demangeonii]